MTLEYLAVLLTKESCKYFLHSNKPSAKSPIWFPQMNPRDRRNIEQLLGREIVDEINSSYRDYRYRRIFEDFYRLEKNDAYFITWEYTNDRKELFESIIQGEQKGSFSYAEIPFQGISFLVKEEEFGYSSKFILRKILQWNTYKSGWGYGVSLLLRDGEEVWMDFRGFFLAYLRGVFGRRYHPAALITHPNDRIREFAKSYLN